MLWSSLLRRIHILITLEQIYKLPYLFDIKKLIHIVSCGREIFVIFGMEIRLRDLDDHSTGCNPAGTGGLYYPMGPEGCR
jgi:hypothetical protein